MRLVPSPQAGTGVEFATRTAIQQRCCFAHLLVAYQLLWGFKVAYMRFGSLRAYGVQARYCFGMALQVFPRSRYVHLSLATMEKSLGNWDEAARLMLDGMRMNPTDAALPQVR